MQILLSPRQREILRLVVEEYVATGQPVGSKSLVERTSLAVSPSTVRNELADLERLGLLDHPHTSAGRVPTEAGYRLYVDELLTRPESRPGEFALGLPAARAEVEEALQATTEMLSQVTRLLALVSAPPLEAATVKHVEVLLLQPDVVLVVVIASTGSVTDLRFAFPDPVDSGLPTWAAEYLAERLRGAHIGSRAVKLAFDDPALNPRERAFLHAIRSAFEQAADENRQLFVGGTAGLLDEMRAEEIGAYRSLMVALEKRAALLDVLAQRLDPRRPFARVGEELEDPGLHQLALVGATYGVAHRTLGSVSLVGPLRMDYEKALRSVRSAAAELSRFVEDVYSEGPLMATDRDYYELLGVPRDVDEQTLKKAFRKLARQLHPDVSTEPDAEARFREVTEAYEVLSNSETRALYDRYGHAGLRSGGFTPTQFDMGGLSDLFAAFFGDDLFGGARRGGGSQRGADLGAEIQIELVDAARGTKVSVPFEAAVACTRCSGDGVEPGTTPARCDRCNGAGRLQQVSRSVFGEFVRLAACPQCGGRGEIVEHPCTQCDGGGRTLERREMEVEVPAGIHDGQRIRLSGEGHAGALGGRAGDVYVLVHVKADPRFVREGNDIYSQVDLTIVQASLGITLTVETLEGDVELDLAPGTQPGEVRVLRGKGMPVLQGFGRGDQRVLVNVAVPRHLSDEQRRLLEEFDAASDEHTYRHDESFFEKLKSAFR